MEKQQKKQVKRYISWGLLVVLVAVLAVMPLIASSSEESDGPQASILSGTVEQRDISTQLIGGGTLISEDAVEITIPAAVKLTEYLVSNGDTVSEGDPIAMVDRVTVMSAIADVQEALDSLAESIEDAKDDVATETVTAQAGGTVKILYAQAGDSVEDVMLEHGALAVLSLDGLMAVKIERRTELAAGDRVCVTFSDDTEVDGRVESNLDGVLVVTVTDDDYTVGETVKVTTEDGDRIGSGTLYIHSQWNATAYSGTVSSVYTSEGKSVYAGGTLMTLKDTGHTAEYQQLTDQHREYEELMLELFQMYQTETLTAPCDGVVSGVDKSGTYMLGDDGEGWVLTLLTNAPNGDDETEYIHYVGQVAQVGIDGLVLRLNPQPFAITDYTDLSGVPLDTSLMTEDQIYAVSVPVYELADGAWVQVDAASIAEGDILLFAGDASTGGMVWIIRVAQGTLTPGTPEATEPADPTQPSEEAPSDTTEPSAPGDSEQSGTQTTPESGNSQSSGGTPSMGSGSMSGSSSGMTQEAESELYSLETLTVAAVTPQREVTLEITVDELDISKLYLGQSAMITVDALSGETFTGTITQIGNTGTNDGGNSKFTVELTVARSENMLSGMNASAYITLSKVETVLAVPVAALVEDGSGTYIYTSYDEENDTLEDLVEVTLGVSDGEYVQVISGLDADQAFYYAYYDTLEISNIPDLGGFSFGR